MVIDTADSFYSNTAEIRWDFGMSSPTSTVTASVWPLLPNGQQTKLMEPSVTSAFDGPQHDDILAVNRTMAIAFENDNSAAAAAALGLIGSTTLGDISLDDNSDLDFYSFVVAAGASLDVTLTPIGSTYLSGPQNAAPTTRARGTNYDSLRIQDLAVRVLDVNGSSQLASVDAQGVGVAEVISGLALPSGAGTYFVEVSGDSADAAQLYELSLSVSPIRPDLRGRIRRRESTRNSMGLARSNNRYWRLDISFFLSSEKSKASAKVPQ